MACLRWRNEGRVLNEVECNEGGGEGDMVWLYGAVIVLV